jgi:hypothetical protein
MIRIFKVILKYYDGQGLMDFSHTGMYGCAFDAIEAAQAEFREKYPNFASAFYSVTDIGSFGG